MAGFNSQLAKFPKIEQLSQVSMGLLQHTCPRKGWMSMRFSVAILKLWEAMNLVFRKKPSAHALKQKNVIFKDTQAFEVAAQSPLSQSWLSLQVRGIIYSISSSVCVSVAKSCLSLCNPVDCSPPASSVHGISQAKILEWVTISFCRGSSWPRNWTQSPALAGRFSTTEPPRKPRIWSRKNIICFIELLAQKKLHRVAFRVPLKENKFAKCSHTHHSSGPEKKNCTIKPLLF